MRSTRAAFFVFGIAVITAVLGTSCAAESDTVIASDLDLSRVVLDGTGTPGQGGAERDNLSLRTPGQADDEQAAPGEVTGRPSPPTLSGNPVLTAPATVSTVATTTTSVPATAQTTTTTQPSTSTTAETNDAAPSDPDVVDSSTTAPIADPSTSSVPVDPSVSDPNTAAPQLDAGEGQSFTLLNDLRSGLALSPLGRNAEMDAFARDWSRQMAETGRFEHSTGPYGENIAFTSNTGLSAAEAAALFHQLWVDSPGHYANMTNDQYTSTGVGLYLTERGWYGTHVFNF